jgi:hypothetical protein
MLSRSHPIILFIDRFGFSLYQDTLTNIPKFNFTQDLVANLDVVNKEQLSSLITTFIQINKMLPSSLAVILSDNVIYVRDLETPVQKPVPGQVLKTDPNADKEQEDGVQSFLENIPFEEVLAKVIKTATVNRVVAINKDLVMTIVNAFVNKGSVVDAIVPSFMYGQSVDFSAGLTPNNVRVILGNMEILKLGNLLTDQETIPSRTLGGELICPPEESGTKKPQNLRQYILIGVFILLLIVLGVVYFVSQKADANSNAKNIDRAANQENVVPTVVPTVVPIPATASATLDPEELRTVTVTISYNAQFSAIVVKLRTGFLDMGFENVIDKVSKISIPEKSSVIFSQNISTDLRNSVIAEIEEILKEDVSILESEDSNSTVSIILGKS